MTRPSRKVVYAMIFGCATIACAALVHRTDNIVFSHRKHVVEEEIDCQDCHGNVAESDRVRGSLLPRERVCLDCHDKNKDTCKDCHTNPQAPGTWKHTRVKSLAFSHKRHLDRVKGDCLACHRDVKSAQRPSATNTPRMFDVCMGCHRKDFRHIDCQKCHEDLVDNPEKPLRLFSHDADFEKRHGTLARGDIQVCSHCHRQTFCSDCHNTLDVMVPSLRMSERVDREFPHRHDFITRHAIEARLDPARCLSCHRAEGCQSCHKERGVASAGAGNGSSPHPAGFLNPSSPEFHGRKARLDIVGCAACHDQGASSNCILCHKVGGIGGRPHPEGFEPDRARTEVPCRYCH